MTLTAETVLTVGLMAVTLWLAYARFHTKLESNWPLLYYVAIYLYFRKFEYHDVLNPYCVYVGVVNALFLRFEFLGGFFEKIPRVIELAFLGYVFWQGGVFVFRQW